jgi:hypothetical protein
MGRREDAREEAGDRGARTPRHRRLAVVVVFVVFVVRGTVPEEGAVEEGIDGGG